MADDKLPVFNLQRVFRLRDRLYEEVYLPYLHQTLDAAAIRGLVTAMQPLLPSAKEEALFESLRYLAGSEFTPAQATHLGWRLAGNAKRLANGRPVLPWVTQEADEWVPVQFVRHMATRNNKDVYGFEFTLRVLSGTSCGMAIQHFWRPEVARLIARKLGFTHHRGKYPYRDAGQLMLLQACVLVEKARSQQKPSFFKVGCPPSMIDRNRQGPLALRMRHKPCPNGWQHACHHCVVGYTQCQGSTHRLDYVQGACQICGEPEQFFDPEDDSSRCCRCWRNERTRRTPS